MLSMVMVTVTSDVSDSISTSSGRWAERTSVGIVVLMIVDISFLLANIQLGGGREKDSSFVWLCGRNLLPLQAQKWT